MLQELSMVEQRYLAVREVLDTGAIVGDVATRYGVNRRTFTDGSFAMPTKSVSADALGEVGLNGGSRILS